MEAVEEPPLHNPSADGLKINSISVESDDIAVASVETDVCHKSNGVVESSETTDTAIATATTQAETATAEDNTVSDTPIESSVEKQDAIESSSEITPGQTVDNSLVVENTPNVEESSVSTEENTKSETNEVENIICADDVKLEETIIECPVDRVTFETEIVVESNDNEIIETVYDDNKIEEQNTNNILSELGESIELSEALRSSDVTDNAENNNCAGRQEVFNKEELLDILEGNDDEQAGNAPYQSIRGDKLLEAQLALQQLTRLKKKPKQSRNIDRLVRRKPEKKIKQDVSDVKNEESLHTERLPKRKIDKKHLKLDEAVVPGVKTEESLVNDLVKEWDDEEATEIEKSNKILEESEKLLQNTKDTVDLQDSISKEEETSIRTSIDSQTEGKTPSNKSGDEAQPQRRLGRVIKKKVIFDPDNPDTFTKSKSLIKNKEQIHEKIKNKDQTLEKIKIKEQIQEKDLTPAKKIKPDPSVQTLQRSKSKSPLSKLQWKKPSPRNCKQNKRLTEIDKLLMDEGAVNMIYQLTPEAPKGKKNMKTKAEFIKKIQSSSTPDTKEMKFRERKKEYKYEEGEARRILGGKHRPSLSSSVKSPSVSEDFEAHSADDSIIYRRHSSSSYSSSCMSPRRLSDVEITGQVAHTPQVSDIQNQSSQELSNDHQTSDMNMFMSDGTEIVKTETINKDDCLSIKEKLNTKLNLALNKRKRENSKADKPVKQKKVMKVDETMANRQDLKYLSISFDAKLAVISVKQSGSLNNLEAINELENVLKVINSRTDIFVTLLLPECGMICSDLDLALLLDDNVEKRTNSAYELAESIRCLLHTVQQHSKLLCIGASGRCSGIALALTGLSDVAFASERTSFAIASKSYGASPIEPGVSVLTAYHQLPKSMLNDLIVFGRRMSASDALQSGFISRVLWPEKFDEQVITIAKDIAAQPTHNLWFKKQMLSLKKSGSESTFLKCLEKERDLFVQYWASSDGQELLRATYNTA